MASLSMVSTPVAREQNSSASQAVIFWSGAKVVALVPLVTPCSTAQLMASAAQEETALLSAKALSSAEPASAPDAR